MKILLIAISMLFSVSAWSWGGRGHDAICRTATFLVKDPGLKEYLTQKPQMMGHLCNMPDFYWKSLSGDPVKLGSPTHFIDTEITGVEVKKIPLDYQALADAYTGKPNLFKNDGSVIKNFPSEFGSVWWRADQFGRRIEAMATDFKTAAPPKNSKEEQDGELPYNKLIYQMIIDMGLMGHFVGDTSQPFHTTADYDGWKVGHGGIHAYYEDAMVGLFDGDLENLVLIEARKMDKNKKLAPFLTEKTTVEKMKRLSEISSAEIPAILKLDPIIEKSTVTPGVDGGRETRVAATRKPAEKLFKSYKKMITVEMARSAVLLANLWDDAYARAGKPALVAYKSYKYPFTVEFIAPDYFKPEEKAKEEKK